VNSGIAEQRKIMAVFNKNTLTQVSGFDNPIIAGELVYQQKTFWNLAFNNGSTPVDLTGATIDAQIIRRQLSNVKDSRYGLTFDISDYTPTPTAIPLTITNRSDTAGTFTLVIDDTSWGLIASDPQLDIASINGAGFSGRIKISFPADGVNPAEDNIIFLLFLVRSDAINN
jgi:hypothetical protein